MSRPVSDDHWLDNPGGEGSSLMGASIAHGVEPAVVSTHDDNGDTPCLTAPELTYGDFVRAAERRPHDTVAESRKVSAAF